MATTYLFADDLEIADWRGMTRTWHQPHKLGTVLAPDQPWEDATGTACPMVVADPDTGLLRMWYWNRKGGLSDLYATSHDGLAWEKPILDLVELDGSTRNNKVRTPGRIGPGSVFYCPESAEAEGPDTIFRTVSWIPGGNWGQRYLPLFSADGLTWRTCADPDGEAGISGQGVGDTGTFLVADSALPSLRKEVPGRYVAFPRLQVHVGRWRRRSVAMTWVNPGPDRSRLMLDWPQPCLALAPDLLDDQLAGARLDEAFAQGVIHYNDPSDQHCEFYAMQPWTAGNLFFGALYVFDVSMDMSRHMMWNQHGIMETQLVFSRDLIHWERAAQRRPWIPRGAADDQDSAMVHFASCPVRVGDRMLQYYSSGNLPHPSVDQHWYREQLARIQLGQRLPFQTVAAVEFRPDGYVSLDAAAGGGSLTTQPLAAPVTGLTLNLAADTGQVSVELLGEDGRRVPGYRSDPVRGDQLAAPVSFARPLAALAGRQVQIRMRARSARLFAFTVT